MASIGSPDVGLSVCKEEEFDKDSGHHSGEEEGGLEPTPLEVDRTGTISSWGNMQIYVQSVRQGH